VSCIPAVLAGDISLNGYYKNFFVAYDSPRIDGPAEFPQEPILGAVTNRIRCNVFYRVNGLLSMSISYNIVPRVQDPSLFTSPQNTGESRFVSYRFADLDARLYPRRDEDMHSFGVFQNLDRAVLIVSTSSADLYLGRQAIAWASARVVNPTDILAPLTFDELDTEDRRGVDAARLRVPLGFMSEIDAGYVFGDDLVFDQSAFFLRGKFYAVKTDISSMLVGFRKNLLVGLDLARSIGGAGVWLEAAHVFTDALGDNHCGSADDYFRATLGLDYVFTGTLYGFVEYHFSQAGTGNADQYSSLFAQTAYTDGAVYLLGRHYLIPGFSYQITPLLIASGQALINIKDLSLLIAPNLEYNIAEDIYLAAGAYIGIGRSPQASQGTNQRPPVVLRSEFGGYSDMYFTSFRIYF
jgi:hypothetical protein